jgi:hypothetical protein
LALGCGSGRGDARRSGVSIESLPRPASPPVCGAAAPPFQASIIEPATAAMISRRHMLCCLAAAVPAGKAMALDAPTGPVLLTVSGRVRMPNQGAVAQFDMAMLERLPQHSFVTSTPWYSQPRRFTGPLLRDVLAACGAQGSNVRAIALNDYRVDLPFDDAQHFDVLLARLLDGQPMAVRDKGPLFIIYPFDSSAELRTTVYYSRSAWQLKSLEVQ